MIFLDASIFLRTLTRSSDPKVERMGHMVSDLFRRVERGEVEVTTSDAVIAEVVFILTARTRYHVDVPAAAERMAAILRLQGVRRHEKRIILRALDLWMERPKLEFVDALTASYAQQPGIDLATFDSDFETVARITRWQPDDGEANGRQT